MRMFGGAQAMAGKANPAKKDETQALLQKYGATK